MTTDRQKAAERGRAERFLTALDPDRTWQIEETERPDFIIRAGNDVVGLEVSDLYWEASQGSPRQAFEALRARVCEQAIRLWDDGTRPRVEVWMLFEPNGQLRKPEVESLAEQVVALVARHLPDAGGKSRVDHVNAHHPTWPSEIHSITISRLVEYPRTHWHARDSDWIPALTRDRIQTALDGKSAKAMGYRRDLDEFWLLLTMDLGRLSSTFDVPADTRAATYRAAFHRVFLFETLASSIVEVKVEAARN